MRQLEFMVPEGAAVQPLSDGARHVLIAEPSMQVTGWSLDGETVRVAAIGGDPGQVTRPGGGVVSVKGNPIFT